jgi:hypothetical protein
MSCYRADSDGDGPAEAVVLPHAGAISQREVDSGASKRSLPLTQDTPNRSNFGSFDDTTAVHLVFPDGCRGPSRV